MKSLKLFALTLVCLASASAQAFPLHELRCESEKARPNHGYTVLIERTIATPRHGGRPAPATYATLLERTRRGPKVLGSYRVIERQSGRPGASVVYLGRDFELEYRPTTAPVRGGHYGHVTAETDQGARVSEDLVCRRPR